MKITYIHHSCFLAESARAYYLFDYESGALPPLDPCKPIFVLVSHVHHDHYQPGIFSLLADLGMQSVRPILSADIPLPQPLQWPPLIAVPGQEYMLGPSLSLLTLRSTDEGIAFLLSDHGELLYHAGDLNDWYWEGEDDTWNRQMTLDYRAEIDLLAQKLRGRHPDIAFVVLDPRQEAAYARGMLYFLRAVGAAQVFPMHYWDQPQIIQRFLSEYPQYTTCIADTEQYRYY